MGLTDDLDPENAFALSGTDNETFYHDCANCGYPCDCGHLWCEWCWRCQEDPTWDQSDDAIMNEDDAL